MSLKTQMSFYNSFCISAPTSLFINTTERVPHVGQNIVPYPHHTAKDNGRGWLTCHPAALTHGHQLSVGGRTSYITAYGSTARQDVDLGPVRYIVHAFIT